ncbi:MAG: rhomboid family intramembrane serine protease [Actinobacteria bacterium]|nr:rhomboid family intramembrane serine protease [Actinomycetota bacterium]MSW37350.1 rhomboid family intramembrane serine protease [Actinomycetota bacterium]
MTNASVGFQCPECVAEGRASVRPKRSRLGARVPTRPYVTFVLVGLCVVAFAWEFMAGTQPVVEDWGLWPVGVAGLDEYYRLVTAMFLHVSLLHIGFNMLVLWMLGPQLENILGHVRFAALYLVAGLGGSVASFWFSSPNGVSVGASGAVFGLMGAYVVVGKALRTDISQVVGLIAINVVLGFVIPSTDWRAHLGGLLTGAVVGAIMAYAPARGRIPLQVLGTVVVLVVLVVLIVTRDAAVTRDLVSVGVDTGQYA